MDVAWKGKKQNQDPHLARKSENPTMGREASNWYGKKDRWPTRDAALAGTPAQEWKEYKQNRVDCWRCGRSGHKTFEFFSFNSTKGTILPPAPWKAAATDQGNHKRKREEDEAEPPATKLQKVVAIESMEVGLQTPWADSEEDF